MSSLAKTVGALWSRRVRINTAAGKLGPDVLARPTSVPEKGKLIRKIGRLTKLQGQTDKNGGLLGFLWDKGSNFAGWIAKSAWNFLSFSATAIFSWLIGGVEKLKAFDWNATDKALETAIANSNVAIASIWGSFVGQGVGWLAGIAVGYGISFLCPVIGGAGLARLIATKAGKEAIEELLPSLGGAIRSTLGIVGGNLAVRGYMNFRRMLKSAPKPLLDAVYGKDGADFIQKVWGRDGGPNMSFNTQVEEAVEAISDKALRAFVDNLLEESWDSFLEAGFVVANEIDNAYAQYKQASEQALGTERAVELTLNQTADVSNREKLQIYKLPQRLMLPAVQQTVNTYRLIHNRDIGLVMGLPVEEYSKAKEQSLRLTIDFFSVKQPPYFRKTSENFTWATITIPDAKRAALDWETIKLACGGANGYLWGRFKASVTLDTGRRLIIYAGSEDEAEKRVEAMLRLTTAELKALNIIEEKKIGERLKRPKLAKETRRVYPAYFSIINRQEILESQGGRANLNRNYRDAQVRIPLWPDRSPNNVNELINQVFRKGV